MSQHTLAIGSAAIVIRLAFSAVGKVSETYIIYCLLVTIVCGSYTNMITQFLQCITLLQPSARITKFNKFMVEFQYSTFFEDRVLSVLELLVKTLSRELRYF